MSEQQPSESPTPGSRPASPIVRLLDLLSSVWLGVALLCLLFIYSSIGSSGVPVRINIFRPDAWMPVREIFELSEYEWFHWWPFDVLIALLCVNMIVATLRRIPLNLVNLGVWLTHAGIIILALGSVWYFSTKVEGDAPVARRRIVAQVEGHEPASMIASPGQFMQIGSDDEAYLLQVWDIVPDWEILSGADKGKRAYKVSVAVRSSTQVFIRELLAGYPQYTEDLIPSNDPAQPFTRARKALGKPLVDEAIDLSLDYQPQEFFYLKESMAIYLRQVGQTRWIERPVRGLPRFNDYIASYDHAWRAPGEELPPLKPVDVQVAPAGEDDPLPDVTFRITDYLRFAFMQERRVGGGDRIQPTATVRIDFSSGQAREYELVALDPMRRSASDIALDLRWAGSDEEMAVLKEMRPPRLHIEVPAESIILDEPIMSIGLEDEPFRPIGESGYRYRVRALPTLTDRDLSLAIVEIARGDERFMRWVAEDPSLTRDLPADGGMPDHAQVRLLDENIVMTYEPGQGQLLRLVAGPGADELRLLVADRIAEVTEYKIAVGEPVRLAEGATITVTGYLPRSRTEKRPLIVPPQQRDRSIGARASMIRLNVPTADEAASLWLPFHDYPFARTEETLRRFPYQPTLLELPDGRDIELIYSRRRMRLPAPAALETFEVDTHIGGFTGDESSILDWRSILRFQNVSGWSEPIAVHMNHPVHFGGLWFFQASWDPPEAPRFEGDRGSNGLNYTILGVANRNGVFVQLVGCCIAAVGMIYAFYVKPYIKRRRRQSVLALVEREGSP